MAESREQGEGADTAGPGTSMGAQSAAGAPPWHCDRVALHGDVLRRPAPMRQLWRAGTWPDAARVRVGVIGSRRASADQLHTARVIARALVEAGAIVFSGGAQGVDAEVHGEAVRREGRTVAVLPGGLARPFPPSHRDLFTRIVATNGALLSRHPPLVPARSGLFLARNVLLAHAVDALIVVCAELRSGSMHGASTAWAAGVPVLAVPWTNGSLNSAGCLSLLTAGARAIAAPSAVAELVAILADGHAERLLSRRPEPPARYTESALDAGLPPQQMRLATIDGSAKGRQGYAPLGHLPGQLSALPDHCDAALAELLIDVLGRSGEAGASLEELAIEAAKPRGEVAATALRLALIGRVRRLESGRYGL